MQRPGPPGPTLEDMLSRMHGKTLPTQKEELPKGERHSRHSMSNGFAKSTKPLLNLDNDFSMVAPTTEQLIDTIRLATTTTATERPLRCCPTSSSWTVSENG